MTPRILGHRNVAELSLDYKACVRVKDRFGKESLQKSIVTWDKARLDPS